MLAHKKANLNLCNINNNNKRIMKIIINILFITSLLIGGYINILYANELTNTIYFGLEFNPANNNEARIYDYILASINLFGGLLFARAVMLILSGLKHYKTL